MDWTYILHLMSEVTYLLIVLGIFLFLAIIKGRQAIMNVTVGLYLALLLSIQMPGYENLFSNLESAQSIAMAKLILFAVMSLLSTSLFYRIMPDEFQENKLETLGKKLLLASGATILVMIFSFHVLPVTEFLTPGTPIQSLFAPEQYYFWWLLLPLVILYVV